MDGRDGQRLLKLTGAMKDSAFSTKYSTDQAVGGNGTYFLSGAQSTTTERVHYIKVLANTAFNTLTDEKGVDVLTDLNLPASVPAGAIIRARGNAKITTVNIASGTVELILA